MDLPKAILYEIFRYLLTPEVFLTGALVCKEWKEIISSKNFKRFWMKVKLGLSKEIPGLEISKIYPELRLQNIVNYEPWKSNGGTSTVEYRNSYYEMWQYNCDSYSTFYQQDSEEGLVKNVCCMAYFTGEYQEKNFTQGFYSDVFKVIYYPHRVLPKYSLDELDHSKVMVLDPLSDLIKLNDLTEFDLRTERGNELFTEKRLMKEIEVPIIPTELIPIIKKIAVARPLFFTGVVKTLIYIFANDEIRGDYQIFDEFNDIENYHKAKDLGEIVNHVDNEEFENAELLEKAGRVVYPVLWLKFKTWKVNHIVVELNNCYCPKIVCAKFIDIDDGRRDYNQMRFQSNFDIMYSLLLGTILEADY